VVDDLEPLVGTLPPDEMAWVRQGIAEADGRFSALVDLLEERAGRTFERGRLELSLHGPSLYRGASCDDGLVDLDMEIDGRREGKGSPPWDIWAAVTVMCDAQPPRHYNCFHEVAEEELEASTPQALVDGLLGAIDRVRDVVAACSRADLVEYHHEGEPMSW
jgi:hypothetical protein